jgi:hypothetical protein
MCVCVCVSLSLSLSLSVRVCIQGWEVLEEVLQAERRERRESMANEADGSDAAAEAAAASDCDWLNAPAASISTLGVHSHQSALGALQPPGGMRSNLLVS